MSLVIQKPALWQRLLFWLRGFDGPLAFAVFMLACAGLITMYSSGYANGERFPKPTSGSFRMWEAVIFSAAVRDMWVSTWP